MVRYLNIKTNLGVETIDSIDRSDFETNKAFNLELKRLKKEYITAGMFVYTSQRSTKEYIKRVSK